MGTLTNIVDIDVTLRNPQQKMTLLTKVGHDQD